MFGEETLSSKNTTKFKDFIKPKRPCGGFFFKLCTKRILTTIEYCNLQ